MRKLRHSSLHRGWQRQVSHHVDSAGASDPMTASLMAEDVRTVTEKSRPSQRKAGHNAAIRPASGLLATQPQQSGISADGPLSCATTSRCAGILDRDEYYSNARIQTSGSRFALSCPSRLGSSPESLLQALIFSTSLHQDILCGAKLATPGKMALLFAHR